MLGRRLVAGPSRVLLRRGYVSAAVSELPELPAHRRDPTSSTTRSRSRTPVASAKRASDAETAPAAARIAEIVDISKRRLPSEELRERAWSLFRELTAPERNMLSPDDLRRLLRSVVPRYDEAWRAVQDGPHRQQYTHSRSTFKVWEGRLHGVLYALVERDAATLDDWLVAFQAFSVVGANRACQRLSADMPERLRGNRRVIQYRLGAIIMIARDMEARGRSPVTVETEAALTSFWELCRQMQEKNMQFDRFTLRLLLQCSTELAGVVQTTNPGAFESLDKFTRFILSDGYGLDLDNLAMSIQQRQLAPAGRYPRFSPKCITATVQHISRCETDPYRVIAAFELLTTMNGKGLSERIFNDEDEDDDMGVIDGRDAGSTVSAAGLENVKPEKRGLFGFKKKSKASGSTQLPGEGHITDDTPQERRFRHNFLPPVPQPSTVAPDATRPLPQGPTFESATVTALLNAFRKRGVPFAHILETTVHDVMASRSAWLSSYLACPPELRHKLKAPPRLNPEWFRVTLARAVKTNGGGIAHQAPVIESSLAWVQSEIDVIVAHESAADPSSSSTSTSVGDRPRVVLPLPEFALDPARRRDCRRGGIFIVSEALEHLYDDRDKLELFAQRGRQLCDKRMEQLAEFAQQKLDKLAIDSNDESPGSVDSL